MAPEEDTRLRELLRASWGAFAYALGFSCVVNLLMLTIPIYTLQVFDRVLPSQSNDTLIYLTIISVVALLVLGLLDIARAQVLTRVSAWIDNKLSPLALSRSIDHTLLGGNYGAQSLADITTIRQFLSSPSIYAFFDAPWVILYIVVIFLLHVALGFISLLGAILLFALALLNEYLARSPLKKANAAYLQNQDTFASGLKNAESIQAMGMLPALAGRWLHNNDFVLSQQGAASDRSALILGVSKSLRLMLQIAIMGTGAYYVVQGELTSGAMIAASIIMGRALAPVEQSISAWKQAVSAMQSAGRLQHYLSDSPSRGAGIQLPKPLGKIDAQHVLYIPPGMKKPVLQAINFSLEPGESLGVIGPSGSGKSTLARLLLGIWHPTNGTVRLDGANIYEWDRHDIGIHVGYLPQNNVLFRGTVKENIARMGPIDDAKVVAAAKFVGAHDLILHLEHGYDADTGAYHLSGGQMQRIGLARAFYGMPKFVVLDEPENGLDQDGIAALETLIQQANLLKITLIIISQRPSLVRHCQRVMVLRDGHIEAIAPFSEVIKQWK